MAFFKLEIEIAFSPLCSVASQSCEVAILVRGKATNSTIQGATFDWRDIENVIIESLLIRNECEMLRWRFREFLLGGLLQILREHRFDELHWHSLRF